MVVIIPPIPKEALALILKDTLSVFHLSPGTNYPSTVNDLTTERLHRVGAAIDELHIQEDALPKHPIIRDLREAFDYLYLAIDQFRCELLNPEVDA